MRGAALTSTLGAGQRCEQFSGQADQREMITQRRLEIALPEALQQNEGQKQREHEIDDRRRFVFEDVIQAPMGRRGVEAVVLDVPAPVARSPERSRGQTRTAERRRPVPGGDLLGVFPLAGDPFSTLLGLHGVQHAQGLRHAFAGGKALVVPNTERFGVSRSTARRGPVARTALGRPGAGAGGRL